MKLRTKALDMMLHLYNDKTTGKTQQANPSASPLSPPHCLPASVRHALGGRYYVPALFRRAIVPPVDGTPAVDYTTGGLLTGGKRALNGGTSVNPGWWVKAQSHH